MESTLGVGEEFCQMTEDVYEMYELKYKRTTDDLCTIYNYKPEETCSIAAPSQMLIANKILLTSQLGPNQWVYSRSELLLEFQKHTTDYDNRETTIKLIEIFGKINFCYTFPRRWLFKKLSTVNFAPGMVCLLLMHKFEHFNDLTVHSLLPALLTPTTKTTATMTTTAIATTTIIPESSNRSSSSSGSGGNTDTISARIVNVSANVVNVKSTDFKLNANFDLTIDHKTQSNSTIVNTPSTSMPPPPSLAKAPASLPLSPPPPSLPSSSSSSETAAAAAKSTTIEKPSPTIVRLSSNRRKMITSRRGSINSVVKKLRKPLKDD